MSKLFIPAALMLCAASALAQHDAALTRADVRSEVARARADHTLPATGEGVANATDLRAPSLRSREDVRSEARDAARSRHIGELYID